MTKKFNIAMLEWIGSGSAIIYALIISANIGQEVLGFGLLLLSSLLFGVWGVIDKRWAFFALQVFYVISALIGIMRWA